MKKTVCLIFIMIFVLTGCSGAHGTVSAGGDTFNITDHAGNTVAVPKKTDRIAVCDIFPLPSVLAVFFNSADRIVAMSPTSMSAAKNGLLSELYPEILNADTSAISGTDVNTEELMKLSPQLVFYNESSTALGEKLRLAGFNAVAVSVNRWDYDAVETLDKWIALLEEIFPDEAAGRAELVRKYSREYEELVKERMAGCDAGEKRRVFFLFQYSAGAIVTSGKNFFGQWWCDAVGAINVAEGLESDNSVPVTMEQIYEWNPDTILITNFTTAGAEDLCSDTVAGYDWSGIDAVRNRRIYKMPLGLYRSYTPGADTPVTLLWLAKTLYPDLFEDIDVIQKNVEYYEKVFDVSLTAEQAESIFNPSVAAGKTDF